MSEPEDADEFIPAPEERWGHDAVPLDEDVAYEQGEGPDEPEPVEGDE